MNSVIYTGHLGGDPKCSASANGNRVAKFSIAVKREFARDGEKNVDFFNCVAFGKTAELVEKYLFKGSHVLVSGRMQTGQYTKQDGTTSYTTDLVVNQIEFLDSKKAEAPKQDIQVVDATADMIEELPFN